MKYMRFMIDRYYANEPMTPLNKGLFTFASYNAGPARVRQLRQEAGRRGLDPNVWFNNVEMIAAEKIGAETVTYVSNIYKYYVTYRLVLEDMERQKKPIAALASSGRQYSSTRRSRSALAMTDTELNVIAALAQIGLMRTPGERIQHAGRDRHADGVVDERQKQVLPDIPHRRAAEPARADDAARGRRRRA